MVGMTFLLAILAPLGLGLFTVAMERMERSVVGPVLGSVVGPAAGSAVGSAVGGGASA